jgi:hypothetical protein
MPGASKCSNPDPAKQHTITWPGSPEAKAAAAPGATPTTPIASRETTLDKGVLSLYLIIVFVLGVAMLYSLYKGTDYNSFSTGIVTALTTIAGYAIGVNSSTPSSGTHDQ